MLALSQAVFGASRGNCFVDHFAVTDCGDEVCNITIAASDANVGAVAVGCASGSRDDSIVCMGGNRDDRLLCQNSVANRAMLAFGESCLGAGRSNRLVGDNCMSFGRNGLLSGERLLADAAV